MKTVLFSLALLFVCSGVLLAQGPGGGPGGSTTDPFSVTEDIELKDSFYNNEHWFTGNWYVPDQLSAADGKSVRILIDLEYMDTSGTQIKEALFLTDHFSYDETQDYDGIDTLEIETTDAWYRAAPNTTYKWKARLCYWLASPGAWVTVASTNWERDVITYQYWTHDDPPLGEEIDRHNGTFDNYVEEVGPNDDHEFHFRYSVKTGMANLHGKEVRVQRSVDFDSGAGTAESKATMHEWIYDKNCFHVAKHKFTWESTDIWYNPYASWSYTYRFILEEKVSGNWVEVDRSPDYTYSN